MTRVLLTGAGGFVGSHVLEHLLVNTDYTIVATDSFRHKGRSDRIARILAEGPPGNDWRQRTEVLTHDLAAPFSSGERQRIGAVDLVLALASESHVDRSLTDPVPFVRNNVDVILNTLELCRQLQPQMVTVMSTDEVYGPTIPGHGHREWAPILPSSPYCVSMGTDIITRRGLIPIEDFSVSQHRTLSRDGANSGVPDGLARRTWQFPHAGEMLRIRTREGREEITCTAEHKFFARVNSHASGGTKMIERRAADLSVGDRVCIVRKLPFPQDILEPEPEYARLLGYWIADGSYSNKRGRCVRLADRDRSMIDFYRAQAQVVCGIAPKSATGAFGSVYKHGSKNCWYLQFASEVLRNRIDLGDRLNVIDQALNFGPRALGQFIAGWIDGDGSVAYEGDLAKTVTIACKDARLRRQLKFLLRRLGVIAVDDTAWDRLSITDSRSLQLLHETAPSRKWRTGIRFRVPQRKPGRAENWMWARIEHIDRVPSDGKVYDLEIGKYHNYLASYFLVHNSASKACQEAVAISYWRAYGVPVVLTNCMNLFGETQDAEKYLPMVIRKVSRGETVSVHGQPGNIGSRHYLHARNLADALLFIWKQLPAAAYQPHRRSDRVPVPDRYNIAGPHPVSNLLLAKTVADLIGVPLRYELTDFHHARPGHDAHYGLNPGKLGVLGWRAPVDFEASLERTVLWSLKHPEWLEEHEQ